MKILILDDEEALCAVLSSELRERGYDATAIADKVEGYEWILDNQPDLIISDIKSPGMHGFQLLRWLKANPYTAKVPFLFLTGFANLKSAIEAKKLGASDFVSKPYDLADLHSTIERILREEHKPPLYPQRLSLPPMAEEKSFAFAAWREVNLALDRALASSRIRTSILPGERPWITDFIVDQHEGVTFSRLIRPLNITGLTTSDILSFKRVLDTHAVQSGILYSLARVSPQVNMLAGYFGIRIVLSEQTEDFLASGVLHGYAPGAQVLNQRFDADERQEQFREFIERVLTEIDAAEGKSFQVVTTEGVPKGSVRVVSLQLECVQPAVLYFRSSDKKPLTWIPEDQLMESLASLWLYREFHPLTIDLGPMARSCLLQLLSSLPSIDSDGLTIYVRGAMPASSPQRKQPLIAILEDESPASEMIADALRSEGYGVTIFDNKLEFLSHANHVPHSLPNLIISDIFSPGINGMEFLKAWKADARFRHVPVCIVSGNIPDLTDEVTRLGASACMAKPFDTKKLVNMVRKAIPLT